MSGPPTEELASLAAVLGEDNVRSLVRTFLRDFPLSIQELGANPDRQNRHRLAHSMKSSSRLVGANGLSQRMAALEARLSQADGEDLHAEDMAAISTEFETIAAPLRLFVGE